jgi:hypothetical protein
MCCFLYWRKLLTHGMTGKVPSYDKNTVSITWFLQLIVDDGRSPEVNKQWQKSQTVCRNVKYLRIWYFIKIKKVGWGRKSEFITVVPSPSTDSAQWSILDAELTMDCSRDSVVTTPMGQSNAHITGTTIARWIRSECFRPLSSIYLNAKVMPVALWSILPQLSLNFRVVIHHLL